MSDPRRIVDREVGPTRGAVRAPRVRAWIVSVRWVSPVGVVGGDEEVQVDAVDEIAAGAAAKEYLQRTRELGDDAQFRVLHARKVGAR